MDWVPSKEYSNVWDFVQNVAINKGTHALKFGVEFRLNGFPFFQVPYPHGEMNFNSNETAFPSLTNGSNGVQLSSQTGDPMASFLLGQVNNGQITNNFISSDKVAWAFYGQDDWKAAINWEPASEMDSRKEPTGCIASATIRCVWNGKMARRST